MGFLRSSGQQVIAAERGPVHRLTPMLAVNGAAPNGLEWAYEFRWSGRRCLALVERNVVELIDRADNWMTQAYSAALLRALSNDREMVLDGVLADFDERTWTFAFRSSWVNGPRREAGRRGASCFIAFDVLWLDGTSLLAEPYQVRRSVLASLGLHRYPHVAVPPHFRDISSAQVLSIARDYQLGGIVAKRLGSSYQPGQYSSNWVTTRYDSAQSLDRAVAGNSARDGKRQG